MIKISESKKESIVSVRKISRLFQDSHISKIKLEAPNWLVYDFFEQNTVSLLFGDSGSHKSFIALDLACCIGTGKSYHGLQLKQSPILYLAAEGRGGIRKRIAAWELVNQINIDNFPIYVPKQFILLDTEEGKEELFEALKYNFWPDVKEKYSLPDDRSFIIFIDTLAKSMAGDEDQTKDMNKILNVSRELQQDYNCTVILIHHTGHSNKSRPRGAYTLIGGVDTNYRIETNNTKEITKFIPCKMKDAEEPEPIYFSKKIIDLGIIDDRGRPVTSLIMTKINSDTKLTNLNGKNKNIALVITAMKQLNGFAKTQKELIKIYQELNQNKKSVTESSIKGYIRKSVNEGYLEVKDNGTTKSYNLLKER